MERLETEAGDVVERESQLRFCATVTSVHGLMNPPLRNRWRSPRTSIVAERPSRSSNVVIIGGHLVTILAVVPTALLQSRQMRAQLTEHRSIQAHKEILRRRLDMAEEMGPLIATLQWDAVVLALRIESECGGEIPATNRMSSELLLAIEQYEGRARDLKAIGDKYMAVLPNDLIMDFQFLRSAGLLMRDSPDAQALKFHSLANSVRASVGTDPLSADYARSLSRLPAVWPL